MCLAMCLIFQQSEPGVLINRVLIKKECVLLLPHPSPFTSSSSSAYSLLLPFLFPFTLSLSPCIQSHAHDYVFCKYYVRRFWTVFTGISRTETSESVQKSTICSYCPHQIWSLVLNPKFVFIPCPRYSI